MDTIARLRKKYERIDGRVRFWCETSLTSALFFLLLWGVLLPLGDPKMGLSSLGKYGIPRFWDILIVPVAMAILGGVPKEWQFGHREDWLELVCDAYQWGFVVAIVYGHINGIGTVLIGFLWGAGTLFAIYALGWIWYAASAVIDDLFVEDKDD